MTTSIQFDKPLLALSPMAGYSDSAFRQICKKENAHFSITEFGSVEHILTKNSATMQIYDFHKSERPIIFQIFGSNPDKIIEACKILLPLEPDGFDLNLGCSIKRINFKGSGVALMKDSKKIEIILSRMVKELKVPISTKMRLGISKSKINATTIAKIAESSGCHFISIHGRTKEDNYSTQSNWNEIAKIKKSVKIPVLGNGDIQSYDEAIYKINQYNLDGVLIGRKAIGNPWIFNNKNISQKRFLTTIKDHLNKIYKSQKDKISDEAKILVPFRKHLIAYLKFYETYLTKETKQQINLLTEKNKSALFKCTSIDELIFVMRSTTQ